jgi:diguanylate cyclase (GGDEF)-like protein/putative nucleotidyltransferase with HDIG domain
MRPETEPLPVRARIYIGLTAALALYALATTAANWDSPDLFEYGGFLLMALCSSGMRISVPGTTETLSLTFLFVLFGIAELTTPETVTLAAAVTLMQCYRNKVERPRPARTLFNVASITVAVWSTAQVYHASAALGGHIEPAIRMAAATCALFFLNTAPAALMMALADRKPMLATWRDSYFWSLPYYLGGAVVAECASLVNRFVGWQTVLLTGPIVYLVYRSYRLYRERVDNQKKHAEEVSSLHLRTIEALALAIDAKDQTTHDHLQRVQLYAMAIARELGLSDSDQSALRAAAMLHDIGKLAVPEHIISKPGRLTPEEFEKMKIHPIVGAEILERVQFPYPVVPIVRAHHEKWDGTGYPYGIAGEDIPIGARILSVVDCLDALASDRQYRRALPVQEAMKIVQSESGKAFDPRVVDTLSRHYVDLERKAQLVRTPGEKLSTEVKIVNGLAPAAGFESAAADREPGRSSSVDFLTSIAAARQEVQALFEISQDLGNSLSLDDTLSVLAVRLRKIIPHHSLAIWVRRGDLLFPDYVSGDDFRLFSTLQIPVGQGLSGWVAENRKPILNGNPSVEPGYLNDPSKFSTLRAAVAVPLEGVNGVVGVMTLYHAERDAFSKDHLRILLAISGKIGISIENAIRFRQAESSATTDFLTTLPNARSLFLHLDSEISRARRSYMPMALMVLDLDGFKAVNDRFGHLEGNRVLREVAAGLKRACREYDYVARMGGDEFVVLLPGAEPDDAAVKMGDLRDVVKEIGREMFQGNVLTVSIGTANFPADGSDAEELLAEADRRMYKQKRSHQLSPTDAPVWNTEWTSVIQ